MAATPLIVVALALALGSLPLADAWAQRKGGSGEATAAEATSLAIRATGLAASFPQGADCAPVASPYASPYRYDGSKRPLGRNGGLHGGIDLSLPEGTPLLALADGTVVHAGEGGMALGIYVWLHFAPKDTGLPYHLFAKYQHLKAPTSLTVGSRVSKGQPVALSGATGTVGGHYGQQGYPHLHLTTLASPSGAFTTAGSLLQPEQARNIDPLSVFLVPLPTLEQLDAIAPQVVAIPVLGGLQSAAGRLVWPVACR